MENSFVLIPAQNQVKLETEIIDTNSLGEDQLLIETDWTFISAGTELSNLTGVEPLVWQEGSWCHYPWRPGYANVGTVVDKGSHVTRANIGDRIFTYAGHEKYALYDQGKLVFPVPEDLPLDIVVASRMAGVASTAILIPDLHGTPPVVVFGLGIVGNLASQMFRARGCRVIAVDPVQHRRDLANQVGIEVTIGGSPEEVQEQVMDLTEGQGAPIVVEAVGHSAVCMQALAATCKLGQLLLLGTPRAPVEANLTDFLGKVHYGCIRVLSCLEWQYPYYPAINADISHYEKQHMILDWIREGRLQLEPLISHRMSPPEIEKAYMGLLNEKETFTGVALQW